MLIFCGWVTVREKGNIMNKKNLWAVIHTGTRNGSENMGYDAQLLQDLQEAKQPTLHLYRWQGNTATYGHFIDPFAFLSKKGVGNRGLTLARRPTGGGIIFHLWDLAFSVAVPASSPHYSVNTLDNYAFVNEAVLKAATEFLQSKAPLEMIPEDFLARDVSCKRFCMAQPTKYDVVFQGRKIAGAAQRKTKYGFLHQGTISLMLPCRDYLEEVLLPHSDVLDAMLANTYPLLGFNAHEDQLDIARQDLEQLLIKYVTRET